MHSVEPKRLSDLVVNRIRCHILDNRLQPGDRLPTEHEFAQQCGVSRLAVREATKALEFLGLVEAAPRRGLTVGALQIERITPYLQFHPVLREATDGQLIDTRVIVETGALSHVVERMRSDPTIYERLSAAAAEFHQAKDLATWIRLDIAFHRQILEASGLAPLVAFNDLLDVFFRRFRESVKRGEWKLGIASHIRMIEALHEGRTADASREMREHVESHRHRMGITS